MRTTVKDVALRAGVSPKTVSNVLNGQVFVKSDTRARVEAAIIELAYVPNLSARALRNGRSGVIALALPDIQTAYSAELAHHLVEAAHKRGWAVLLEETGVETDREWNLVSRARRHLVDGLILNPVALQESAIVADGPLPPVVLIGEVEQSRVDQVRVDSVAAAYDMTQYLLGQGVRRIATVGSPQRTNRETAMQRRNGYRQAMAEAGLEPDPTLEIGCDDWSSDGGAQAVGGYLDSAELPEAFFCFTDSMALGVLGTLAARGVTAPRDTLVAGFDNISDSRHSIPPLTTVSFDRREFTEQALELLTGRIEAPDAPVRRVTIAHKIVERASTMR